MDGKELISTMVLLLLRRRLATAIGIGTVKAGFLKLMHETQIDSLGSIFSLINNKYAKVHYAVDSCYVMFGYVKQLSSKLNLSNYTVLIVLSLREIVMQALMLV